jgi:triphosphoribosyl-dephospho-CoA synthase
VTPDPVALATRAFVWACALDVGVRKPGNVSFASPGHAMTADQFIGSALAAAVPLFVSGTRVGARIEGAIQATRAAAGCNTNLGIVLLAAPLAAAVDPALGANREPTWTATRLRQRVERTLAALDVEDARAAYRAIALASPGGLGAAAQQDVRDEPSVDLRSAMRLAADRDDIARQYDNGYADVFEVGLVQFGRWSDSPGLAMLAAWLELLARRLDSHIVRKHGPALAQSVTEEAARRLGAWKSTGQPPADEDLAHWDGRLKSAGINPGTTADLAVAAAFAAAITDPRLCDLAPAGLAWNVLTTNPTLTRQSG